MPQAEQTHLQREWTHFMTQCKEYKNKSLMQLKKRESNKTLNNDLINEYKGKIVSTSNKLKAVFASEVTAKKESVAFRNLS